MWAFQIFYNFKTPHDRQKGSLVVEGHMYDLHAKKWNALKQEGLWEIFTKINNDKTVMQMNLACDSLTVSHWSIFGIAHLPLSAKCLKNGGTSLLTNVTKKGTTAGKPIQNNVQA